MPSTRLYSAGSSHSFGPPWNELRIQSIPSSDHACGMASSEFHQRRPFGNRRSNQLAKAPLPAVGAAKVTGRMHEGGRFFGFHKVSYRYGAITDARQPPRL